MIVFQTYTHTHLVSSRHVSVRPTSERRGIMGKQRAVFFRSFETHPYFRCFFFFSALHSRLFQFYSSDIKTSPCRDFQSFEGFVFFQNTFLPLLLLVTYYNEHGVCLCPCVCVWMKECLVFTPVYVSVSMTTAFVLVSLQVCHLLPCNYIF